jgi:hypothetical protein
MLLLALLKYERFSSICRIQPKRKIDMTTYISYVELYIFLLMPRTWACLWLLQFVSLISTVSFLRTFRPITLLGCQGW